MYYVSNHHPGIIDRDTWDKVQEIYNERSNKTKDGKIYCQKYSLRYPFSSKIICNHCRRNFVRRSTKYKNKDGVVHNHIYWTCSSTLYRTNNGCKKRISIKEYELKKILILLLKKLIKDNEVIKEIDLSYFNESIFREVVSKIEIELVEVNFYAIKYIFNKSIFNYINSNNYNKLYSIFKIFNHSRFDTNSRKRHSYVYKKIKIRACIYIDCSC